MTRPAAGGNHNGKARRAAQACQLCDFHNSHRYPGGRVPRAVAMVSGYRLCANHLRLVRAIAADAGVEG